MSATEKTFNSPAELTLKLTEEMREHLDFIAANWNQPVDEAAVEIFKDEIKAQAEMIRRPGSRINIYR